MYFYYVGNHLGAVLFLPIYGVLAYVLGSGLTPMIVLTNLQVTTIPIMAISKVLVYLFWNSVW